MTGLVPAAVAWPLLAGPLLALAPGRVGDRLVAAGAVVAAGSTVLLAASDLAWPAGAAGPASVTIWLDDRLARSLALLVSVPWLLVSVRTASAQRMSGGPGWRRWQVAAQLVTGGAILACRAAPLFLMLPGLALVLAGAALLHDHYRRQAVLLASILLTAWLGMAVLGAGLGHPPAWTKAGAAMPAALRPLLALLVLPLLLLAWICAVGPDTGAGPVRATTRDRIARALLPVPVAAPVLDVLLRLRLLAAPDDSVLIGIGMLGLLLAVCLMPARRELDQRLSLAAAVQIGAAVVGLGVGGSSGAAAALMILLFLALSLPVALLPADGSPGAPVRRLAVLAIAGMPPFGPFLAGFVLLPAVFAAAPVPAVLLLAAFACTALLLLSALRRVRPAAGPEGRLAAVSGVLVLALLGWLGLAMPNALSGWLLDLGEAASGSGSAP